MSVTVEELDKLNSSYEPWRKVLISFSNKDLVKNENQIAVHLEVEQVFYNHNKKSFWIKRFELNDFVSSQYESVLGGNTQNSYRDIITNYMLGRNPKYLQNYNSIYFAEENGFVDEKAYLGLTQFLVDESVINEYLNELVDTIDISSWYRNEFNEEYKRLPLKIRLKDD